MFSVGALFVTIYPLSLTHRRRMEAEAKAKLRLSYIYKKQRWEFAPLLIGSFAHLLISLKSNERLWAIRSDRSRQMSDYERIAQVAQEKWVTMSDLLSRSREMSNPEQIAQVAHDKWANELFAQKMLAI